ncbi:MAG: hypothetical protein GXO31_04465 [Epsilonproteobacteria bacterium]|nr:hypothetical protein [Campylobacterota bacterium]
MKIENIEKKFLNLLKESKTKANFPSVLKEEVCRLLKQDVEDPKEYPEILKVFIKDLKKENLDNINVTSSLISAFIEAKAYEDKKELYDLLNQKELIEQKIEDKKEDIKKEILLFLNDIESDFEREDDDTKVLVEYSLNNVKLQSLDLLGILKETTMEALLGAIEKGGDIEGNIEEIVKSIVYEAINEGKLTKVRIAYIVRTVLDAAIEIADEDQAFAKEILNGTIYGSKRGISRAIGKFKNELKLIPNEVQKEIADELEKTKNEIENIEEDFINVLRESALKSKGISKSIINEIILKLDNTIEKLKRKSAETTEAIAEKIKEIKEDSVFENELTAKAVQEAKEISKEAKKVGKYLLEITKEIVNGAIKGAKEVMKKE